MDLTLPYLRGGQVKHLSNTEAVSAQPSVQPRM